MARCALCQEVFPSKLKLVQHFSEAHSIARQRPRRSKVTEFMRRISQEGEVAEVVVLEEEEGEERDDTNTTHSLHCFDCSDQFTSQEHLDNHDCNADELKSRKQPVACQYCGQICKDRRGAAIHQAFCEKKQQSNTELTQDNISSRNIALLDLKTLGILSLFECPSDNCGAIFKTEDKLTRHIKKHHNGESISVIQSNTFIPKVQSMVSDMHSPPCSPPQPTQAPLVTVTMKPHVGKTDGLQDLSLLVTPATCKPQGVTSKTRKDEESRLFSREVKVKKESLSITVEECVGLDGGSGEAVLYVNDDGTVINTSPTNKKMDISATTHTKSDQTRYKISLGNSGSFKSFECDVCQQCFTNKVFLDSHAEKHKEANNQVSSNNIKSEPIDEFEDDPLHVSDDDWEVLNFGRRKSSSLGQQNNLEYKCSFCKRNFLSELGYQMHVKNKECKNKKFKLPRMFACHFKQCDSSYFKLTELQRHWQNAHKYFMTSQNLEFEDEGAFTDWLAGEEEKYKVRFTCDVKRRKTHRTERLLVCHRFHHLRTSAARKSARRQYSDKHNWVHKIEPCLCFARMKVYQEYNDDGKITVVYYPDHSHPDQQQQVSQPDVLDHVLQRNKRKRNTQFQDLKGNEKLLHRQKLERFARLAGKEYRPNFKSSKTPESTKKLKKDLNDQMIMNEDEEQMAAVNAANNLLGNDELFASQVEMVLDGQFDMGHEVLITPGVTHLDSIPIFTTSKLECNKSKMEDDQPENHENSPSVDDDEANVQVVLPASSEDWQRLFEMVRSRLTSETDSIVRAEAEVLLPYEKVIELVPTADQIPIFRQLWELAYPPQDSQDGFQIEYKILR